MAKRTIAHTDNDGVHFEVVWILAHNLAETRELRFRLDDQLVVLGDLAALPERSAVGTEAPELAILVEQIRDERGVGAGGT